MMITVNHHGDIIRNFINYISARLKCTFVMTQRWPEAIPIVNSEVNTVTLDRQVSAYLYRGASWMMKTLTCGMLSTSHLHFIWLLTYKLCYYNNIVIFSNIVKLKMNIVSSSFLISPSSTVCVQYACMNVHVIIIIMHVTEKPLTIFRSTFVSKRLTCSSLYRMNCDCSIRVYWFINYAGIMPIVLIMPTLIMTDA